MVTEDSAATGRGLYNRGGPLGIMLTGGGARAAYQVGLLKGIAHHFPDLQVPIITGASAGAINAVFLASQEGTFRQVVKELVEVWCTLENRHIFTFNSASFLPLRSLFGTFFPSKRWTQARGILDSSPLFALLARLFGARPGRPIPGLLRNIAEGRLEALALMGLDYSTGQSVRWVQGTHFDRFEGPNRRNVNVKLTVDHVMASASLPFVFPAIRIGERWYGDGGIRLAAPLAPVVHLGASRVIAMSTGYRRTVEEASRPVVRGYPPAAQIVSQLMNAVFIDAVDEDVERMQRLNDLLAGVPPEHRGNLRPIDLLVFRPSRDLGRLSSEHERELPLQLKLLMRALGVGQTESPDLMSMLMFEPDYTRHIIEIGEQDVEDRLPELRNFLSVEQPDAVAV